MKRYLSLLLACTLVIAACNNQQKTEHPVPATISSAPGTEKISEKECFISTSKKDTVALSFTAKGNVVTGELMYQYFEKDKNTGTITGKFYGDTLLADYTFMSEGVTSVREVAFLKNGENLTEGYAESADSNGMMKFKDRKKLKFTTAGELMKTSCN